MNVAPGTTLDTGLAMVSMRSLELATIVGLGLSALGSGDGSAATSRSTTAATWLGCHGRGLRARSPTRSTATTSARSTSLEFRHEPEALALVIP